MRFDVKHAGSESSGDKNLVELLKSPAVEASSLKKKAFSTNNVLSLDLNEILID